MAGHKAGENWFYDKDFGEMDDEEKVTGDIGEPLAEGANQRSRRSLSPTMAARRRLEVYMEEKRLRDLLGDIW